MSNKANDEILFMAILGIASISALALRSYQNLVHEGQEFNKEIQRLTKLLKRGYTTKDPATLDIRGVTFKPYYLRNFDMPPVTLVRQELAKLQKIGFNAVRTDWQDPNIIEEYLDILEEYGFRLCQELPSPPVPIGKTWHHYDPFEDYTVEDWTQIIHPHLQRFGTDHRFVYFSLTGEAFFKTDDHIAMMKQVINFAKVNSDVPITIGFDSPKMIDAFIDSLEIINFHAYPLTKLRDGLDIEYILEQAKPKLQEWQTSGKPIIFEETGFPTWRYGKERDSSAGNSPYAINNHYLYKTSPQTELLQKYCLANMVHFFKENNVKGYLIYQWFEDPPHGEGGFGLTVQQEQFRYKPALEVLP